MIQEVKNHINIKYLKNNILFLLSGLSFFLLIFNTARLWLVISFVCLIAAFFISVCIKSVFSKFLNSPLVSKIISIILALGFSYISAHRFISNWLPSGKIERLASRIHLSNTVLIYFSGGMLAFTSLFFLIILFSIIISELTKRNIIIQSETTIDRVIKLIILSILGIYIAVIISSNYKTLIDKLYILAFLFFVIFNILLYIISKRINSDKLALVSIIIISSFILVGWNIIYQSYPVSDYKVIWEGAHQIIDGSFYDRAANKSDYFAFFNFQIPYTYYISLLLRICDNIITLKIAEIVTLIVTNIILYKILCLYCSIGESFFGSVLFSIYPYIFIGSGIINNHHIGMLLGSIALYVILKMDKYPKYAISATILVIGNLLRPTVVVIFLAIAFTLLVQGFFDKRKWLGLLLLVFVYFGVNEIVNYSFIAFSLAPYGIKGNDMYFKILLGLTGTGVTQTPTTDAEHTFLFYDLQYYNFDYGKYKEASKDYLLNLIFNGKLDYHFVFSKIQHFISGVDNQYMYGDTAFNNSHISIMKCLNSLGRIIYTTTIFGAFIFTLKQKSIIKNSKYFVPAIAFCAYFGVYIFIEVQTRYRYEQYFLLFLISVPLIYSLLRKIETQLKNKNIFSIQINKK